MWRSARRAASTSASSSEAGVVGWMFSVIPTARIASHGVHGQSVTEEEVVGGGERDRVVGRALGRGRRSRTRATRETQGSFTVIQTRHLVRERLVDERRVLREPRRGVPVRPSPGVLERLRQVPVVQRDDRLDPVPIERVDQSAVVVESALVHGAAALRHDPGPRHREPVRADPELGHQGHVLFVPVVLIAGDVTGVAVPDLARLAAERVPDGCPRPSSWTAPSTW